MKPRPNLPPGPYLVVGLARSGAAAALALRRADPAAPVVACDRGAPPEAETEGTRLGEAGVEVHLNTDGTELLSRPELMRTLVKSPGVPPGAAVVREAKAHGVTVVGELEIGWRLVPNEFLAVTGTNGKTTTTELIGAVYEEAGRSVAVAGNVGTAVSALAGEIDEGTTVVCEASSFQLEDAAAFAPETAVFLNFSEDHLDRHPSAREYLDAKLRLFSHQAASDVAVLNSAEPVLAQGDVGGSARRVWFGEGPQCDLRLQGNLLSWQGGSLLDISELQVRGAHNVNNVMAAAAATLARGIEPDAVRSALREFRGIEHRLEEVGEAGGILYVNDSKATNVSSALAALRAFAGGVHAILGGSLKDAGFAALAPVVGDHCRACYLIGEAAEQLAADLEPSGVELVRSGDLERAFREASTRARSGDTVLLTPACASFDQYGDYEERGEHFRALFGELEGRS